MANSRYVHQHPDSNHATEHALERMGHAAACDPVLQQHAVTKALELTAMRRENALLREARERLELLEIAVRPSFSLAPRRSTRSAVPRSPSDVVVTSLNVDRAEDALITRALQVTGGNRTRAAELLGCSVRTLRNKLNARKGVA